MKEKEKLTRQEKKEQKRKRIALKKEVRSLSKQQTRVGRATAKSLGLFAFDDNGIFQMMDGRWICFYRNEISTETSEAELLSLIKSLPAITEIYSIYKNGELSKEKSCLSFTVFSENISDALKLHEKAFSMAGEKLGLVRLGGFEVLSLITGKDEDEIRNEIRLRKDLWREHGSGLTFYRNYMEKEKKCISAFRVLQFPIGEVGRMIKDLSGSGEKVRICLRIIPTSSLEELDFLRILEKKYNRQIDHEVRSSVNVSLQFEVCFDMPEACDLVFRNVRNIFLNAQGLAAFAYSEQQKVSDCLQSYGFIQENNQIRGIEETFGPVLKSLLEDI